MPGNYSGQGVRVWARLALAALACGLIVFAGSGRALSAQQVLLGDQTIEAAVDSDGAGTAEAFRTSATTAGSVSALVVYVDSTASTSTVVAGLYSASGSHPGALLSQGTLAAPTKGAWNTVPLTTAVPVAAGTTYWIAILSPNGGGTIVFRDAANGGASETSSETTLGALASTWSTGAVYQDGPLSAYGVSGQLTPDATSPSTPTALHLTAATSTSLALGWTASTDNVGVTGYDALLNSVRKGTSTSTSFTYSGLTCGTTYALAVDAFDAAANSSPQATIQAATGACDTTAPSVRVTTPAANTTVSSTTNVSASATDDTGVVGVQFKLDGTNLGSEVTTQPYSVSWDTTKSTDGAHALTAVVRDAAGNTATAVAVNVTVSNAIVDTAHTFQRIPVGNGVVEATTREIVRTAGNRVYAFVDDDTAQRLNTGSGVIRAYRATTTGNPTAFAEADAAHHPTSTGSTHVLYGPDVRLDRSGIAHLVYVDQLNGNLYYQTFSTVTDTWGARQQLATGSPPNTGFYSTPNRVYRSWTTYNLLLDNNDAPVVVYSSGNTLYSVNRSSGTWSSPKTIAVGTSPIHPVLAADAAFDIYAAWLDNPSTEDRQLPQACGSSIRYARLDASTGAWSAPETIDSGCPNVLSNQTSDQGPSIVLDGSNQPVVEYLSGTVSSAGQAISTITIKRRTSSGWVDDSPPSSGYGFTHAPQIYSQGNDLYTALGHDQHIWFGYLYQLSGQAWAPYKLVDSASPADGSASIRWDPQRETNPHVIDLLRHGEDKLHDGSYQPELFYYALLPTGAVAAPDTSPPTVSITAPAANATVSGTITASASAADNVAVAGVQFLLDGRSLGAAGTASPYQVAWATAAATDGTHTLSAVARDAAGNRTTSSAVSVTVNNAPQVLFGAQAVQTQADSDAAGRAEAFKATATASGSLGKIVLYVDSGTDASQLVVGVYADAGGHPGTLLTQGAVGAPAAGSWASLPLAATAVTSGTSYWIAVLGTGGTLTFRDQANGGPSESSAQTTLTQLPAQWSSGQSYTDGLLSAYGST